MKKQTKTSFKASSKNIIILALLAGLAALLYIGITFGTDKMRYYNQAADQAGVVQVRELVILAVRGLKKDAPVEPQTGDVYFPESRLYLPNPATLSTLTYLHGEQYGADSQTELSISTYPVRGTAALYAAQNMDDLFASVPQLQACSRGIKITYSQLPEDDTENELQHVVLLRSGQYAYIYLEKACPELKETADLLKGVQSY